jgi:hypothetical protein
VLSFPYLAPPSVPSAFDDEFNDGSPALEDRGWQVFNSGDGMPMTRRGDVTVGTPAPSGTQYNSSIVSGTLRVQATSGMMVLKPITVGPVQVVAKLGDPRVSADHYMSLQLTDYNRALDDTCQRVAAGYTWGFHVFAAMYVNQYWYTHRKITPPADGSHYVFLLEVQQPAASFDWRNAVISAETQRVLQLDPTPIAIATFLPSFAGFEVRSGEAPYSWVEIDYIRMYPFGSWFPV